jgi:hypothetical protein
MNFYNLPSDIIYYICSFLNKEFRKNSNFYKDTQRKDKYEGILNIISLSQVNRRLREILNNENYWKGLYNRDISEYIPFKNIKRKYYNAIKYVKDKEVDKEIIITEYEKLIYCINIENVNDIILCAMESKYTNILIYLYNFIKIDIITKNEHNIEKELNAFDDEFFHSVVSNGNLELFKFGEEKGYKYDIKRVQERLAVSGYFELFKYLENKYSIKPNLIHGAARGNKLDMVKYITKRVKYTKENIDTGIAMTSDFKILKYLWPLSSQNLGSLETYVDHRINYTISVKEVMYLVGLGFDIHWNNEVLLKYMCKEGNLEAVKYLVIKGADINIHSGKNNRSKMSLWIAISKGHNKIIEYLIKKGADTTGINGIELDFIKRKYPDTYKLILKLKRQYG